MSASFGIQKTAVGRQEGRRSRACNNHAATERQLRRTSIKICRGDASQGVSTWQQGLALRSSCSDERSAYPRWQRIQSIEIERRCINTASAVSQLRANSCPLDPLLVTQGRSIATAKSQYPGHTSRQEPETYRFSTPCVKKCVRGTVIARPRMSLQKAYTFLPSQLSFELGSPINKYNLEVLREAWEANARHACSIDAIRWAR